jgi:hypothetical protein
MLGNVREGNEQANAEREMDTIKNKSTREIQLSQQNACKNVDELTDKLMKYSFQFKRAFYYYFLQWHEIKNLIKRWWWWKKAKRERKIFQVMRAYQ